MRQEGLHQRGYLSRRDFLFPKVLDIGAKSYCEALKADFLTVHLLDLKKQSFLFPPLLIAY